MKMYSKMLDHFHIWVKNLPAERLLEHPLLFEPFTLPMGSNTAEIKGNVEVAIYRNLKFKVVGGNNIDISGSLHKYAQNGRNYSDFTFEDMTSAIKNLCYTFGFNPSDAVLRSFEFGLNLPINAQEYIDSLIIHQTTKPAINYFGGNGLEKLFAHQEYDLKFYDKCAESKLRNPMIRYEIRIKKMSAIKALNILTLMDLMDVDKFRKLKSFLIKPLKQIIFFEVLNTKKFKKMDADLCLSAGRATYWSDMAFKREEFKYKRKKYNAIAGRYGSNIKKNLIKLVETKIDFLMSNDKFQDLGREKFPKLSYYKTPQISPHYITAFSPFNLSIIQL